MAAQREEGELSEEGELPEEPGEVVEAAPSVQPAPAQQPRKPEPAAKPVLARGRQPAATQQLQVSPPGPPGPPGPPSFSARGRGGAGALRPHSAGRHRAPAPAVDERARERERAALAAELDRLTNDLSFQELRSNWEPTCTNVRNAIKKLDKLLRRVKRKREDDVELYPGCFEYAARIAAALKHVIVICSTGLGRLADMELANSVMLCAVNYRHDIFSSAQKRELEQQIKDSKEFRWLFTDRNRAKGGGAKSSDQQQQQQQQQERMPLQRGSQPPQQQLSARSDVSKDDDVSDTSHAQGGATSTATPSAAAPPPPPAAAESSQQEAASAAASSHGAAPAARPVPPAAAAPPGASQIRIVLNTTQVGSAAAAADGGGSGLKRSQIQDLDAGSDSPDLASRQQQAPAAKRARVDTQHGDVSQLPEVAAALADPSELQLVLQQLLHSERLCLVLDLDHTLVNSAKFSEVDSEAEYRLEQLAAEQLSRPREARDLHRLARVGMWTKLRPGVRQFLARAAGRFELWIYTAGSKAYADAMVELLDPSGAYFGRRIIAQGAPAGGADEAPGDALVFKRLMQGLEGREPVVLIVDDSSAVWPHDRRNLFVVERYIYFPSSRRRFGMQGKSLMEVERDECPQRGMLMTALKVFEQLHARVFAALRGALPPASSAAAAAASMRHAPAPWDVRAVMAAEKRTVLQGVCLVFSRVIPLESDPRAHPLWQLAEQFGASCSEGCGDATTHVVATHGGTEKVMWARQHGRHVVSPAWLECSCILWQRASEERFPTPC